MMTTIEAEKLLKKYYPEGSMAFGYLYEHSMAVAAHAVKIAEMNPEFNPDIQFIRSSAILHDIGIFMTHNPDIGCYGEYPYLAHGYLGREILEKEGFTKHALVCERHVGVGISKEEIIRKKLPIPQRDMIPLTVEEEIVCYADKFYSKNPGKLSIPKDVDKILKNLEKYGADKPGVFREFMERYGVLGVGQ
jgi:uncharacterized protein